jgi:DNA mismatch endonuclease (patch repair protein)
MDRLSKEKRSEIMSKIRGKNTSPELAVRKLVFSLGYRYRLHVKNLPGKPDLVFPGRKKVIFVHGCFWHYHTCRIGRLPKTRAEYWLQKLETNKKRDGEHYKNLIAQGWKVLVVWECELKNLTLVKDRIVEFLEGNSNSYAD